VPRNYSGVAERYAASVVAGRIPACKWVQAACQRQLDDLTRWRGKKRAPYRWNAKPPGGKLGYADRVCYVIEQLPHIKGPLAGQKIRLGPWQIFILTTVFGWTQPDGARRFRRAYIEVPRGNGKSAISSGLALYMLAADNESGAECYSAATTRDQARIVFGVAQQMARRSPAFRRQFGIEVNAHNINVVATASKLEALSAEGSTLDGLNVHFGGIDELHAHRTRAVYDVVETGCGKRHQSLLWVITTAGSDRSGICYEVRTYCTKLLERVFQDDSQFGVIYTLDEGDDWQTEAALKKANPNWGVSVRPEVVMALRQKAMQLPAAQNNFLTKHCNLWVNADVAWMDMRAWERCADSTLDIAQFEGEQCFAALDLASKTDFAPTAKLFRRGEHVYAFMRYYLPEDTVYSGLNAQYQGWVNEARLTVTEGNVIDFAQIEEDLRQDAQRFEMAAIAYDPWQATQLATKLAGEGLPMVELRQNTGTMSEPMKELQRLVLAGKFHHDGDPILTWMVSNVVAHLDVKDNIYPRKERPENKIDGPVAVIMALNRMGVYEEKSIGAEVW
jgi:phage terminase large subunit-like protein